MHELLDKRGDVAILWIDNPPVNAINSAVKRALVDGLQAAQADADIRAVVIACRGRTFMAGADIREFHGIKAGTVDAPDALEALRRFPKLLVAAVHGTALGGGFEVALASDYRLATPGARLGLPEVTLGLLPGWGGTQRLPRLVGVKAALDFILAGSPISAPAALRLGVIDQVVEGDLIDAALGFAREHAAAGRRPLDGVELDRTEWNDAFFAATRERVARERRDQHAPQRIVDCIEAAVRLPIEAGLRFEREQFMRCLDHPQSAALQHVFFAERQLSAVPGLDGGVQGREVRTAAVIGAGTMGGGIAMSLANAGIPVRLLDASAASLDRGLSVIRRNYEASAQKGRLSPEQVEQRMALIQPTLSYEDLADADFIIEAVFELMDLKKTIFARLDQVAKPGAILASNTSFLSIDEMAAVTRRPGDVVGTHFFAPANVMRLLEVVRGGSATSPETLKTALDLARRMGKVGVVAGNCDGFIGNRMVVGYLHQADLLVLEGATPSQVDQALVRFGMAMGPFQMYDLSGLDLLPKMRRDRGLERYDARAIQVSERLVERGRHGQKTRAGYYDYGADRKASPSPEVEALVREVAAELGIARRAIADEEIVERCVLAMVNIGCDILHEQMAYRASDIDVVYLHGYAFPAHRGGPMYWAQHELGLERALEKIRAYSHATGERWLKPSAYLAARVRQGLGLYDTPQALAA